MLVRSIFSTNKHKQTRTNVKFHNIMSINLVNLPSFFFWVARIQENIKTHPWMTSPMESPGKIGGDGDTSWGGLSLAGYCQTFSCFFNNVASFVASPQIFKTLPGMFQGPRIEARIEESQAGTPLWNHPVVSCTTSFFQTCLKRLAMEVTRTETQKTEVEVWLGNGSNEELPPLFFGGEKNDQTSHRQWIQAKPQSPERHMEDFQVPLMPLTPLIVSFGIDFLHSDISAGQGCESFKGITKEIKAQELGDLKNLHKLQVLQEMCVEEWWWD